MVNNMLVLYFADGCPLLFVIFITDFKFCVKIVNVFHLCTKTIRKFSTVKYNNLVANKLQPYQLKKVRNTKLHCGLFQYPFKHYYNAVYIPKYLKAFSTPSLSTVSVT